MKKLAYLLAFAAALGISAAGEQANAIYLKSEQTAKVDAAAKKKDNHWCLAKDLPGVWDLIYFNETPPGTNTRFHRDFPYETMIFAGDNKFAYVNSNRPSKNPKADVLKLQENKSEAGYKYFLSNDGKMLFTLNKKPYRFSWCQTVPKSGSGYKQGDIILTTQVRSVTTTRVFRRTLLP